MRNVVATVSPFIGPRQPPANDPGSTPKLSLALAGTPAPPLQKTDVANDGGVLAFLGSCQSEKVCQMAREACRELACVGAGVVLPEGAVAELCSLDCLMDGGSSILQIKM